MTETAKCFVLFDPSTDTRVVWNLNKEDDYFGITLKRALETLVNAIAKKTDRHPAQILTDPSAQKFVIRIEPRERKQHERRTKT